jgi:branched-chain amino acid aminotransferase
MTKIVLINGKQVETEDAKISVFDRGFLYGDSVFETLRTYGGVPFALEEHLRRLERSAQRVLIRLPEDLSVIDNEIRVAASLVHSAAGAGEGDAFIRVMVTRGIGDDLGLDPNLASKASRVIIAGPLQKPSPEAYEKGAKVVTYRTQRFGDATAAVGSKVGNYLVAVLAMREASAAGAVEALIVDGDDRVVEGTTSNVFAVVGGRLVTPPEQAGILEGITRAHILEIARDLGIFVDLAPLSRAELWDVDELFICSTVRELLPVVRVDDRSIGTGRPGPTTRKLLQLFRQRVASILGVQLG